MNDLRNPFTATEPKQPEPVAQVFGRPLSPLARLFRAVRRALFGHEFTCWHMDADGDVKKKIPLQDFCRCNGLG